MLLLIQYTYLSKIILKNKKIYESHRFSTFCGVNAVYVHLSQNLYSLSKFRMTTIPDLEMCGVQVFNIIIHTF